jgi:2-methylcitrate dehydratase PrpD
LAALELTVSGHLGPRDALETVFGRILGTGFDAAALVAGKSEPFQITTNYFKRHSACRYTHPTLDALDQAIGERGIDPGTVVSVRVECDARAAKCDDPAPVNGLAARFSVPFAVATRIVNGRADIDAFSESTVASTSVRALSQRVSVTALPNGPQRPGAPRYPACVTVELSSGEQLVGSVERALGDMPTPLAKSFVREKFATLAGRAIAPDDVDEVSAALLAIGEAPSISAVLAPLRRALTTGA